MKINDFFDAVLCINLSRRQDRWEHCLAECEKHDIKIERFIAADMLVHGVWGCTTSHLLAHEYIVEKQFRSTLILEDDFSFRFDDSQDRFSEMIEKVPSSWDILYLGGHYGQPPIARVNENVIRCGPMLTSSSVAFTLETSRIIARTLHGIGPIDCHYGDMCKTFNAYCLSPRLVIQYECFSDIQNRSCNNEPCMTDCRHEEMV